MIGKILITLLFKQLFNKIIRPGSPTLATTRTVSALVRQLFKSLDEFQLRETNTYLGLEP